MQPNALIHTQVENVNYEQTWYADGCQTDAQSKQRMEKHS